MILSFNILSLKTLRMSSDKDAGCFFYCSSKTETKLVSESVQRKQLQNHLLARSFIVNAPLIMDSFTSKNRIPHQLTVLERGSPFFGFLQPLHSGPGYPAGFLYLLFLFSYSPIHFLEALSLLFVFHLLFFQNFNLK